MPKLRSRIGWCLLAAWRITSWLGAAASAQPPADRRPAVDRPAIDRPAIGEPANDRPEDDRPANDRPEDDRSASDLSAGDSFRAGDRVVFELGSRSQPGVVVAVESPALLEVRLDNGGRTRRLPSRMVRLIAKGPAPQAPAGPRTWTDSTGTFQVVATLLSATADTATIRRADGRVITLPIARLSAADRQYVRIQSDLRSPSGAGQTPADNRAAAALSAAAPTAPPSRSVRVPPPASVPPPPSSSVPRRGRAVAVPAVKAPTAESPTAERPKWTYPDAPPELTGPVFPARAEAKRSPQSPAAALKPTDGGQPHSPPRTASARQPRWAAAPLRLLAPPPLWNVTPDAAQATDRISPVLHVALPALEFFEDIKGLTLAPRGGWGLLTIGQERPGKPLQTRVLLCGLASGKIDAVYTTPSPAVVADIRDDGNQVLALRISDGVGDADEVELWRPGADGLQMSSHFAPYDQGSWSQKDVTWARYADSRHLLTCNRTGKLVLWRIADFKPLWQADIRGGCTPTLSPNRRQLAVANDRGAVLLHPLTGQALGLAACEGLYSGELAFREDGRLLAAATDRRLVVWELASGETVRDMQFSTSFRGSPVDWVADDYVLVDNQYLIDVARRVVLWDYEPPASAIDLVATHGGITLYLVSNRESATLRSIKLPHDRALAAAAKLDAEELLLLKPGAEAAIVVQTSGDQQYIREALAEQLTRNGVLVVEESPLQVVATTGVGRPREVCLPPLDDPQDPFSETMRTRSIIDTVSRLEIRHGNRVLWSTETLSGPSHVLQLRGSQTADDAVWEAQQPDLQFFRRLRLPKYVVDPARTIAHGRSQILPDRVQHISGGS